MKKELGFLVLGFWLSVSAYSFEVNTATKRAVCGHLVYRAIFEKFFPTQSLTRLESGRTAVATANLSHSLAVDRTNGKILLEPLPDVVSENWSEGDDWAARELIARRLLRHAVAAESPDWIHLGYELRGTGDVKAQDVFRALEIMNSGVGNTLTLHSEIARQVSGDRRPLYRFIDRKWTEAVPQFGDAKFEIVVQRLLSVARLPSVEKWGYLGFDFAESIPSELIDGDFQLRALSLFKEVYVDVAVLSGLQGVHNSLDKPRPRIHLWVSGRKR